MRFLQRNNHRGFTLLELILTMLIVSLILGVATEVMLKQGDAYSLVNSRKSVLQDVRYALSRIKTSLDTIDATDLNTITSTSLKFYDDTGTLREFRLASIGPSLGVYYGTRLLVGGLQDFTIGYYDGNGAALIPSSATLNSVRRMSFTMKTQPTGNEGSLTMSMQVIPRDFLGYTNFE